MTFFWSNGALCARPDTDEEYELLDKLSGFLFHLESFLSNTASDSKTSTGTSGGDEDSISNR